MADCERFLELLSAQIDGMLTEAEERELLEHVLACPDCQALQEDLLELSDTMSDMHAVPPEDLTERIMNEVGGEKKAGKIIPFYRRKNFLGSMLTAAAMLALVAVSGTGLSSLLDENKSGSADAVLFSVEPAQQSPSPEANVRFGATQANEPLTDDPAESAVPESANDEAPELGGAGASFVADPPPALPEVNTTADAADTFTGESMRKDFASEAGETQPTEVGGEPDAPQVGESNEMTPAAMDGISLSLPLAPADNEEAPPEEDLPEDAVPLSIAVPTYVGEITFRAVDEVPDFLLELGVPAGEDAAGVYRLEVSADEYRAIELQFIAGEFSYEAITEGEEFTADGAYGVIWIQYE